MKPYSITSFNAVFLLHASASPFSHFGFVLVLLLLTRWTCEKKVYPQGLWFCTTLICRIFYHSKVHVQLGHSVKVKQYLQLSTEDLCTGGKEEGHDYMLTEEGDT